jgi:hypothetical protein
MKSSSTRYLMAAAFPMLACAGLANATLGGFEAAHGYQPFLNMVQDYNAGQYGALSGYVAVSPVAITPSTGLWHNINGGFFSGGSVSYATGHQGFDRTYVNSNGSLGSNSDQGLVLTTGHEGLGGPALKYKYDVDAQDLGGMSPGSTGSAVVSVSFWARGFLDNGLVGAGYFGNEITFEDSLGNIGFNLGMTKTSGGDKVTYWNGTSLFVSSLNAGSNYFDRWDISLDLVTDTVTANYFEFNTGILHPLFANVPMSSAMSDFTHMTFRTTPGVNNSKFYAVDDFSIRAVPTPGALGVFGFMALAATRRRR